MVFHRWFLNKVLIGVRVPRYLNINGRTVEEYSPDGYSRVKIVDVGLRRKKRKVKKESGLRYSLSRATTRGKERSVLCVVANSIVLAVTTGKTLDWRFGGFFRDIVIVTIVLVLGVFMRRF